MYTLRRHVWYEVKYSEWVKTDEGSGHSIAANCVEQKEKVVFIQHFSVRPLIYYLFLWKVIFCLYICFILFLLSKIFFPCMLYVSVRPVESRQVLSLIWYFHPSLQYWRIVNKNSCKNQHWHWTLLPANCEQALAHEFYSKICSPISYSVNYINSFLC